MLKICVAGAAGRMGNAIINEAYLKRASNSWCNRGSK